MANIPGVDERGALVVDQKLAELEVKPVGEGRGDPVDPIDDLIDPRHGYSFRLVG